MTTARVLKLPLANRTVRLDDGPETIAFLVAEIRRTHFTYKELSERCGVCAQAISKIACHETRFPRMATVIKIAMALGWSVYAETSR